EILGDAIKNSINILLMVSGFIISFSVFINLLDVLNVTTVFSKFTRIIVPYFGISEKSLPAMLKGFFEITTGIKNIGSLKTITLTEKLIITSIILGWGGLSVHLQVISILSKTDLSIKIYIIGKLLHGLISGMYTFALLHLIKPDMIVSYYFIDKLKNNISYSPHMCAAISIFLLSGIIILILIIILSTIFLFYIKYILSLIKQLKC
ncbi:MAG TPA: sporulation integral membrane protein YlbJ, partial [Gallicola sp.]|nr:sporulation integral membrane protein YlbJ [Gallicola sp.]